MKMISISPWTCGGKKIFHPLRIGHFSLPRNRNCPACSKHTRSGDPEDHLKAISFGRQETEVTKESNDSLDDLRDIVLGKTTSANKANSKESGRRYTLQAKSGRIRRTLMERYKAEVLDVEGAPECMRISRFIARNNAPWVNQASI
ncbi:hypothetical protein Tco_0378766 [Tanacetum coccineum]